MIEFLKKYIIKNKNKSIFYFILFTFTLFLLWFSFNDVSIWWDEAVYIGMGKYIATGGDLGMWEMFRPPLLPLFYSLLFKLNIPIIFTGKIIVVISSIGSVWLVYYIGESIKKGSGLFSSIFLMITPVFFVFSRVPMTDVISIFFVLLSLSFFIKEKYFLTGVFISLTFLLRFPQGLIIVPIGIAYIINSYDKNLKLWFKNSFIGLFKILLGFLLFILPFLISNYILYGDVLKPFILARGAVSASSEWHNLGRFYYAITLLKINPFLYLALFLPFILISKNFSLEKEQKKNLIAVLLTTIIVSSYFLLQTHKEFRYSLAFIPYFTILSGIFFAFLLDKLNKNKILLIMFIISVMASVYMSRSYLEDKEGYDYVALNNHLMTLNGSYLSTNPIPASFGKIRIISLFETADSFNSLYNKNVNSIDGVFIKDCDIFCPEKHNSKLCLNDLKIINDTITKSSFKKNYETKINGCTFSTYKK